MKTSSIDRSGGNQNPQSSHQKELPDIQARPIQQNQNGQGNNSSATPQANSSNLAQLSVVGPSGSYSVTNKGGAPQLPAPNSRSQANQQSDNPARHSKLRGANAQGAAAGTLQQIKGNKKSSSRDNTLPSAGINDHHQKQVKPSELSLDLIIPSTIRGAKQSPIGGGHAPAKQGHTNQVNAPMLVNLRTPQNNNGILQPIQHQQQMKKKELQNILSNHDQSLQSLQQSLKNQKFNRNHGSNRVAPSDGNAQASNQNEHLTPLKGGKESGIRGQHGHHHLLPGQNLPNSLNSGAVYQGKLLNGGAKHHRGNSVDALNNSVEMRGKIHMIGAKQSKHPRDQSVRISRFTNGAGSSIDGENTLLHNSVHDFERAKNKAADQLESLSVSGSHHQAKIKEVSRDSRGRRDGHEISKSGHQAADAQQAGEEPEKLNKDVQLNLQNLIQIDEKLTALQDCLKRNQFGNISQLCSEWWELTDEDDYTISKFQKAIRDERARREIKQQMSIEILSIAIVNYFTSSPEIFRPTSGQLGQVKALLAHVHQNFLSVAEFMFGKLPQEALQNQFASKFQLILKQKKKKTGKNTSKTIDVNAMGANAASGIQPIKQYNDSITSALKNISRQGTQAASNARGANLSPKKLIALRNQGMLKNQQLIQSQALKPLYQTTTAMISKMETVKINQVREAIIRSSETIEDLKLAAKQMLPPLYGVGGTAIGGYEPLPVVQPPYLPAAKDPDCYTLVLDLDETLVHYYEVNGEGNFRIRPGCEKFLKEMADIYEVVIFTAAMQDYADWVLDSIDKPKHISYRLYRQHASPTGMVFVKDLSRIGRPLHKTIIVDNVAENFSLQPDNGIFIKSWFEDTSDTALHELAPLLKQIVEKKVKDVREALRKFRDQMLEQIQKGVTNPQLCL